MTYEKPGGCDGPAYAASCGISDEDLDWHAPKGKVNVQVLGSWIFVIALVGMMAALLIAGGFWLFS